MILAEDTFLDARSHDLEVQNLQGAGDVEFFAGASLNVNYDEGETLFSGDVMGEATAYSSPEFLIKGTGTMVYSGTIDTGTVVVAETAELRLDEGEFNAVATNWLTVEAGGTLSGTGGAGYATVQGTLSPGHASTGLLEATQIILEEGAQLEWSPSDWQGSAGSGWPQIQAEQLSWAASSGEPVVIRINTDELSGSDFGTKSFLFVESPSVSGFNEDEFVIVDESSSPLPGEWKLVERSSGLALEYWTIDRFSNWIGTYGYTGADALAE